MAKKQPPQDTPQAAAPIITRISYLLSLIWHGNKSLMARELGVSHPVVFRVTSNQQEPPGKLLEALARWPRMNLHWLFLGEGEPLLEPSAVSGAGRYRPVSTALLPGAPSDYPHLLEPTSLPVAEAYYSPTSYWFCLTDDCSITKEQDESIKAGDYLLIETEPEQLCHAERLYRRLCALHHADDKTGAVVLGRVGWGAMDYIQTPNEHSLRLFGEKKDGVLVSVQPGEKKGKVTSRKDDKSRYHISEVVGVCIVIQRTR